MPPELLDHERLMHAGETESLRKAMTKLYGKSFELSNTNAKGVSMEKAMTEQTNSRAMTDLYQEQAKNSTMICLLMMSKIMIITNMLC
jgi:hypothetical protein